MVTINSELEHLPHIDENISPEERAQIEYLIRLELANQFNNNMNNFAHHLSPQQQQSQSLQQNLHHNINNPQTNILHQQQLPHAHPQHEFINTTGRLTPQLQQQQQYLDVNLENLPLHPMVDRLMTPTNTIPSSSLLDRSIQHYEEEELEDDDDIDEDDTNFLQNRNGVDLSKYTNFNMKSPLEGTTSQGDNQLAQNNDGINYNNLYTTLGHATIQQRNLNLLMNNRQDITHLQNNHLVQLREINENLNSSLSKKRIMIDETNEQNLKKQKYLNDQTSLLNQQWKQGINTALELKIEAATTSSSSSNAGVTNVTSTSASIIEFDE
ncbi:hypothetical protein KGF54_001381 [Candida jiufengensis]|uniref:uncharacterized protein n=1 Tax=Candida jiufengensis TaxID=497108 RepID=UPI00222590B2|nr:uncharacterized protein KGF54_001381 [Candida jiufengensis]KAI5955879.1 hypothetical protein KGF54_001381 [Candida jiufengensis]